MWEPTAQRAQATAMHRFMQETGHDDYDALYQWSVNDSPAFWEALCKLLSTWREYHLSPGMDTRR